MTVVNLIEWISGAVSLAGSAALVLLVAALWSPYVSRILAAMLLAHADGLQARQMERRLKWSLYHRLIVEKKPVKVETEDESAGKESK